MMPNWLCAKITYEDRMLASREMELEVVKIAEAAMEKHELFKDMAWNIKYKLDSIYGRTWGCVLVNVTGRATKDYAAAFNADLYTRFIMDDIHVTVFREMQKKN
ncbi:hypothetical protein HDE_07426 [Halotydeus destructor]|nr:hypothetical protein HDE_07426 [Halotydeus destructor]